MESVIEKAVCNKAERAGWFVRKVQWGVLGRCAAPDRIFIKGGRTVWLEFKDQNKKPTLLQQREHERMRAAGAEVHVVDSVKLGFKVLGLCD